MKIILARTTNAGTPTGEMKWSEGGMVKHHWTVHFIDLSGIWKVKILASLHTTIMYYLTGSLIFPITSTICNQLIWLTIWLNIIKIRYFTINKKNYFDNMCDQLTHNKIKYFINNFILMILTTNITCDQFIHYKNNFFLLLIWFKIFWLQPPCATNLSNLPN